MKYTAIVKISSLLSISVLIVLVSFGQTSDSTKIEKFYTWVANANISIRKSFDGSKKDEEKPASFFWGLDHTSDFSYTVFDAGLKISEVELLKNTKSSLLFFPKLEWHKDGSNKEKEKNSLSGGINMEFFPIRAASPPLPGGIKLAPFLLGSYEYQRDYIKDLKTTKPKLFLSFYSNSAGLPGSQIRFKSGAFFLRYYPYTGIEWYKTTDSEGKRASYWASRIFLEAYPIPSFTKEYFQLTFDYTYRSKLSDNLFGKKDLNWLSVGANFYPDGRGKIGLGLEYSKGDDPSNNFVDTDKISFGLRLKF